MTKQVGWVQEIIIKCNKLLDKNKEMVDPSMYMLFKKLKTNLDAVSLILREGQNLSHPYHYPEYIQMEFPFVKEVEEQSRG